MILTFDWLSFYRIVLSNTAPWLVCEMVLICLTYSCVWALLCYNFVSQLAYPCILSSFCLTCPCILSPFVLILTPALLQKPHLTSVHSWCGIFLILVMLIQILGGCSVLQTCCCKGKLLAVLWLAIRAQVTRILSSDWPSEVMCLEYCPLIGHQRSGD